MRIPSNIKGAERAARSARVKESKKSPAPKSSGARRPSGVSAAVSPKARSLANDASYDIEKVERLRDLIERGEFTINYNLIAEQIMTRG